MYLHCLHLFHKQINCFTNQKMCCTESLAQQFLKGTQSNVDYVRKMVQNLPLSISHIKFHRFRVLQFLKVGLSLRQTFVTMSNRLCKLQDGQQAENLVTRRCILQNRQNTASSVAYWILTVKKQTYCFELPSKPSNILGSLGFARHIWANR